MDLEDRVELIRRDGPVHFFEIVPRSDVDALNARLFVENQRDGDVFLGLREYTDLSDQPTHLQ